MGVEATLFIELYISRRTWDELDADRLCGGGVGRAFGAIACPVSAS